MGSDMATEIKVGSRWRHKEEDITATVTGFVGDNPNDHYLHLELSPSGRKGVHGRDWIEGYFTPIADAVDHPPHYTSHPSGVECIDITRHYNFAVGNAIKYLWRAGLKGDAIEDLKKAAWYINDEIARREKEASK